MLHDVPKPWHRLNRLQLQPCVYRVNAYSKKTHVVQTYVCSMRSQIKDSLPLALPLLLALHLKQA